MGPVAMANRNEDAAHNVPAPSLPFRRAVFFAGTVSTLCACNGPAGDKFFEGLFLVLVFFVVVYAVEVIGLLTVLIVNIYRLSRGKPSMGWGIASLVCGATVGLGGLTPLAFFVHGGDRVAGVALGCALCFVGWKNVAAAKRARPPVEPL